MVFVLYIEHNKFILKPFFGFSEPISTQEIQELPLVEEPEEAPDIVQEHTLGEPEDVVETPPDGAEGKTFCKKYIIMFIIFDVAEEDEAAIVEETPGTTVSMRKAEEQPRFFYKTKSLIFSIFIFLFFVETKKK